MSVNINYYATYVELQDIPSYSTNITVEGQLLKLSFLWNERIGKRVLSIKNSSDVVYLQNTILHPNEPLELNSNAVLDDLPYSVTLVKTGDVNKVGNIFNWSKDFILCFSRTVDLDVKKLNVVYGVTTPSTPILLPSNGGGGNGNGEGTPTSCVGATSTVVIAPLTSGGYYQLFKDSVVMNDGFNRGIHLWDFVNGGDFGLRVDWVDSNNTILTDNTEQNSGRMMFTNTSDDYMQIKVVIEDAELLQRQDDEENESIIYTRDEEYGIDGFDRAMFCLSPAT